jgi:putative SOS response-associated peptidase YedK
MLDRFWWGLIPYWCNDASGGRKAINAKGETVASLPSFRDAYRRRLHHCECGVERAGR